MFEYRCRVEILDSYIAEHMAGKLLTDNEGALLLRQPCKFLRPDGRPLLVYTPGAVSDEMSKAYSTLQGIRGTTSNRGLASGTQRIKKSRGPRTYAKEVASNIIGSFDAYGPNQYCRLTAYNAKQVEEFETLVPLFRRMAEVFAEHVPERYRAQERYAERTEVDWVIPGTPFTTVTVNSTYPTGVHMDKGDLDEGFSCLAVGRRGDFTGGVLTLPAFGLSVDLRDGDMVMMDAHAWHGNTNLYCSACWAALDRPGHICDTPPVPEGEFEAPERISVVAYYRTGMAECGSLADEDRKRAAVDEAKLERATA